MRKIVLISKNIECVRNEVRDTLSKSIGLVGFSNAEEGKKYIDSSDDTFVILIDNPSTIPNIRELINYIENKSNYFFSLPILIITDKDHVEEDESYLGGTVVDCVEKPIRAKILENRILNARRQVSGASFDEFADMLKNLPAIIYLKDEHGRYVFSSQTWNHLDTGGDPDWTIAGKTDLDIRKDKGNAQLAMKSDLEVINSGKGVSYIIEENANGQEFLQIIKEPLFLSDGSVKGIIALINNVTEQELLKRKLKEQSIIDNLTGTYNRCYYMEYLQNIRLEDLYPLSIIVVDCDNLKFINDTYGHMSGDRYIRHTAELLESILPNSSCIFRVGGDEFIAFIPDTDNLRSIMLADRLRNNMSVMK